MGRAVPVARSVLRAVVLAQLDEFQGQVPVAVEGDLVVAVEGDMAAVTHLHQQRWLMDVLFRSRSRGLRYSLAHRGSTQRVSMSRDLPWAGSRRIGMSMSRSRK